MKAILNNGTICNIEIQLADNKDTAERFLYYWSKIYSGQLVKGEEYKKLTDVLELYILEIPKARKILEKDLDNELAQWMAFLDDPNKEEVSKIMEDNQEIKKAMNELEEMSEDEELRRLAELREKAIRDEQNGLRHAKEEGIKEGIIEIAKEMKKQNYTNEEIQKITKLTKEEIENL